MRGLRNILPVIAALLLLWSCGGECYENQNALPQATFVVNGSQPAKGALNSVKVYGLDAPNDSILWEGGQTEQLFLPFRVDSDTTIYIFEQLDTESRDTVTFLYQRAPQFVSAECGVSFRFIIKSITNTGLLIDSVTCPNGEITNENIANLIIYLKNEQE